MLVLLWKCHSCKGNAFRIIFKSFIYETMTKIQLKTDQNNPAIRAYREAVEKGKNNQHILPYGDDWAVSDIISSKADFVSNSPQDALAFAENRATKGTAIFIHGPDGRIVSRKDY